MEVKTSSAGAVHSTCRAPIVMLRLQEGNYLPWSCGDC
jgi:hypothetical protein